MTPAEHALLLGMANALDRLLSDAPPDLIERRMMRASLLKRRANFLTEPGRQPPPASPVSDPAEAGPRPCDVSSPAAVRMAAVELNPSADTTPPTGSFSSIAEMTDNGIAPVRNGREKCRSCDHETIALVQLDTVPERKRYTVPACDLFMLPLGRDSRFVGCGYWTAQK